MLLVIKCLEKNTTRKWHRECLWISIVNSKVRESLGEIVPRKKE
jgi:hypothetical protein